MTFNTTKCEVIRFTWKAITIGKRLAYDIQYHKVPGHTFSELKVRLVRRETGLSPPVKYFSDRSKAVILLWIICVIYILCLSCFRVCSLLPYGHLKGKG